MLLQIKHMEKAMLFLLVYSNIIATISHKTLKKAYPLRHSVVDLDKCSELEPCKDRSVEDKLNAVCGYGCSADQSLRCLEQDGKILRFCYDNKICPPGTRDKTDHVDGLDDKIVMYQTECPPGYFQPHPTQCDKACQYRHVPVPAYMVTLHPGNASASAVAYCDSESGWVSIHGQIFFNVSTEHGSRMCERSKLTCKEDAYLLPNGTCAVACRPGHHRVPRDSFNCRETGPGTNLSTTPMLDPVDDAAPPYKVPNDQTTTVLAVVCSLIGCAFILVGVVFTVKWRKRNTKKTTQTSEEEGIKMLDVSGSRNDSPPEQNNDAPESPGDFPTEQNKAEVKITVTKEKHYYGTVNVINVDNAKIKIDTNN